MFIIHCDGFDPNIFLEINAIYYVFVIFLSLNFKIKLNAFDCIYCKTKTFFQEWTVNFF